MPLFGPLVAYLPTPRTRTGALAASVLGGLVERAVTAGASGVAVLGSVGGFAYLEPQERRAVVEVAVEAAAGRVPVMAGVGALTTRDVLGLVRDAAHAGAAALLLPPTAYLPLTDDEVLGLYRDVTQAAERPVWIYHNPVTTRYDLTLDVLARLAALPGIGGVKDRAPDAVALTERVGAAVSRVPAHVEVGCSGEVLGAHGLLAGARTWHSALAGLLPEQYVAVAAAAATGDRDRALALLAPLEPLAALATRLGGLRAVHALAPLLGVDVGAPPAPLRAPAGSDLAELERLVDAARGDGAVAR